ncbi:MAG: DUF4270 domain-containing protein [Flavobacteriaceae bacterium]|nr:DUF4270 domain-containing protein [Flavobacteriaceae bacterium]
MKFNFLFKTIVVGFLVLFIASCDKDVNEIGAGILGEDHYGLDKMERNVIAYSQNMGAVQTNDLPINSLGYYNNPVFGKTKASFVSQLQLTSTNPSFYRTPANIVIDSVYLYVPYFSSFQSTDATSGDSTYSLDSIHGANEIDLKVYESKYFLKDHDPSTGFLQLQKYYSNQQSDFDSNTGVLLNDDNRNIQDSTLIDNSQNSKFKFSDKQIKLYKNVGTTNVAVKERLAPGMVISLKKDFFRDKIFNAPSGKLFNNDIFKDYFRGLYFKVGNAPTSLNQGSLAKLNFANGYIRIAYRDNLSATNTGTVRRVIQIKLGGHSVNLFENDNNYPGYVTPNPTTGDQKLFVKGGDGSMAVIDLFGGLPNNASNTELQAIKNQNLLINEANLTFHIDKDAMKDASGNNAPEPNRIYLYDLNNKRPLVDFYSDFTTSSKTKYSKYVHGGIIKKDSDSRGTTYKIKITNHIRNLVLNDSTNVRLGLVVTENINSPSNANLLTPITNGAFQTKFVPVMSVVNPLGTILYGSNIPVGNINYDKRLKLEIYYTKPN